jgi:isopentenyl diphosphate isomerase/L-lactate dehydrogenase-like FMN-dependent dehydrogenase
MKASGKKQAWDYYSSGADDELTYNENVNAFQVGVSLHAFTPETPSR